jgi:hypothetical protein
MSSEGDSPPLYWPFGFEIEAIGTGSSPGPKKLSRESDTMLTFGEGPRTAVNVILYVVLFSHQPASMYASGIDSGPGRVKVP